MKKYIKNFNSIESAKEITLFNPTLVEITEGEQSRILIKVLDDEIDTEMQVTGDTIDNIEIVPIGGGVKSNQIKYTVPQGQGKITLKDNVNYISHVFNYKTLTGIITFENDITVLPYKSEITNDTITSATFPNTIISIGMNAFIDFGDIYYNGTIAQYSSIRDKEIVDGVGGSIIHCIDGDLNNPNLVYDYIELFYLGTMYGNLIPNFLELYDFAKKNSFIDNAESVYLATLVTNGFNVSNSPDGIKLTHPEKPDVFLILYDITNNDFIPVNSFSNLSKTHMYTFFEKR